MNTTTRPTELPATTGSIFELVDATDDETYYTLGLYLTLQDAVDDACHGDSPPTDCYGDIATLEVRERKLGYSGHSNNGKKVAEVVWTRDFESDEDSPWRFECKSNVSDQTPAAQDSANTSDSSSRLSASALFVLGCSWLFI